MLVRRGRFAERQCRCHRGRARVVPRVGGEERVFLIGEAGQVAVGIELRRGALVDQVWRVAVLVRGRAPQIDAEIAGRFVQHADPAGDVVFRIRSGRFIAAVVFVIGADADRQVVRQLAVQHGGGVRQAVIADFLVDEARIFELRLFERDVDRAPDRAAAIQRALRPGQDFEAFDIVKRGAGRFARDVYPVVVE